MNVYVKLNVLSSEMDQAKSFLLRRLFIQRRGAEISYLARPPHPVRALERFSDTLYSCWQLGSELPRAVRGGAGLCSQRMKKQADFSKKPPHLFL
jgi:hypothetical protein